MKRFYIMHNGEKVEAIYAENERNALIAYLRIHEEFNDVMFYKNAMDGFWKLVADGDESDFYKAVEDNEKNFF